MMKRLATILLLVILASAAGFVAPRPASACSCMQLDPTSALAEYPAAFVGTLVDVDRPVGGFVSGDADTVYRFEVEEWVKGDLGAVVDVHSAANGAACGIEVGVGNQAGIFVSLRDGQYTSSLCETIDADVLLAGAEPLVVGAPGPGVLLVSGNIGGFNYVVLNGNGEIVAGVNGPDGTEQFEQPWQFSLCPQGETLVEQWGRWMIVRDLSDLSVIRKIDLQDYANTISFTATRCMTEDGSEILLAGEEWTGNQSISRIFTATDIVEPGADLPPGQVSLADEFAVVQDYESGKVSVVDYESGEATSIHIIERTGSDENYVGVTAVAIAPDSSTVAVSEVRYDGSEGAESSLVLYEAGGKILATAGLEGEVYWLSWLDSERMVANRSTNEGQSNSAVVYASPSLDIEHELDGWQGYNPVLGEGLVYAIEGGSVVTADLKSGEVGHVATLPTQSVGPIAILPVEFEISPDLVESPEANTPNTVPPLFAEAAPGELPQDVTGMARGILIVLLVAAAGWAGYLALKRNRNSQGDESNA